ncbi:uncharacterized protein EKO05_0009068 [Ascochyta rabiei]|uniref:uncharacterized protein n=1 Tax=Didymella rabiei TaxID=5454 RepID=UPI0022061CD0|nr:uncharacterized protein EKO05_0009068 [Ascochyta rabiei]UPX18777.1 hypothetical protein EKO05_0009068 [Ascochyta rabiei]
MLPTPSISHNRAYGHGQPVLWCWHSERQGYHHHVWVKSSRSRPPALQQELLHSNHHATDNSKHQREFPARCRDGKVWFASRYCHSFPRRNSRSRKLAVVFRCIDDARIGCGEEHKDAGSDQTCAERT